MTKVTGKEREEIVNAAIKAIVVWYKKEAEASPYKLFDDKGAVIVEGWVIETQVNVQQVVDEIFSLNIPHYCFSYYFRSDAYHLSRRV